MHFTVDSLRAECAALRDQKKKLVSAIERLEQNLSNSRAREAALTVPGSTAGVTSASAREADLEMELEDAKAQMGDLFLEIEAIVNSEEKSRDQCSRILQQMSDNQLLHQSVLEENSKLTIENKSLKIKMKESEIRFCALDICFFLFVIT